MTQKHEYGTASHWDDILQTEFQKESDRAAVILVASLFDSALGTYLKNYLLPTPTSTDELFDAPNAPLGTFSAKINFAHRVGLISHRFCRDLHLIRKVRNEFAHNVHGCSFDTSAVRSRVLELAKSSGMIDRNLKKRNDFPPGCRGDFLLLASWMLFSLNQRIEESTSLAEARLEWGYNPECSESDDDEQPNAKPKA